MLLPLRVLADAAATARSIRIRLPVVPLASNESSGLPVTTKERLGHHIVATHCAVQPCQPWNHPTSDASSRLMPRLMRDGHPQPPQLSSTRGYLCKYSAFTVHNTTRRPYHVVRGAAHSPSEALGEAATTMAKRDPLQLRGFSVSRGCTARCPATQGRNDTKTILTCVQWHYLR